jgi:hypothetical protein
MKILAGFFQSFQTRPAKRLVTKLDPFLPIFALAVEPRQNGCRQMRQAGEFQGPGNDTRTVTGIIFRATTSSASARAGVD